MTVWVETEKTRSADQAKIGDIVIVDLPGLVVLFIRTLNGDGASSWTRIMGLPSTWFLM